MRRLSVLIADDHAIVAEGIQSLLRDKFDLLGCVSDGQALVEAAARLLPSIIVADISMPKLNGLEAVRLLKEERIPSKVLFLTMHSDADLVSQAIEAGASGYVLKQSAGEELTRAIDQVLAGRFYLSPLLDDSMALGPARPGEEISKSHPHLTVRQRDVLRLIAEGKRMKEIAADLGISRRTAETHKYEMMQSLGVQTTAELVRHAVRINLVAS